VKIVAAAIKHESGRVFFLPQPYRHCDVFMELPKGELANGEQGFMTDENKFVNRTEAYKIADKAGQILRRPDTTPGTLYTEDLW